MNRRRQLAVAAVLTVALPHAAVGAAEIGANDVLYAESSDWFAAAPDRRIALAAAFMRIFCTDARMAPEQLVLCLDQDGSTAPVLERALTCATSLSRSG